MRFAEHSDRPTSLVYRVPVTAPNHKRTHQVTLPGADMFRSSDCHKREYLPASQRQAHLHSTCTAGGTRRCTEAGPERRGFLIMSLYLPPSPSNMREKQLSDHVTALHRNLSGSRSMVVRCSTIATAHSFQVHVASVSCVHGNVGSAYSNHQRV